MADVNKTVQTTFTVVDRATRPLRTIASAGSQISRVFDQASHLAGMFGSAAAVAGGAFSAHEVISGTLKFLNNVNRLKDYTKMTAENAGAVLDAFEETGLSGEETVRIFSSMERTSARTNLALAGGKKHLTGTQAVARNLGIDMSKGPQAAMMQMAKLAQQHKLRAQDVLAFYRMAPESARKFVKVLEKGPEHLAKSMEEFKKLNIATEANVASAARIKETQTRIANLWEQIQQVIGVQLLPVIEDLLSKVEGQLDGWMTSAQAFGKTLGSFLRDHYQMVLRISKVLLLNFTLMKATGQGMGTWLGRGTRAVGREMFGGAGPRILAAAPATSPAVIAARMTRGLQVGLKGMFSGLGTAGSGLVAGARASRAALVSSAGFLRTAGRGLFTGALAIGNAIRSPTLLLRNAGRGIAGAASSLVSSGRGLGKSLVSSVLSAGQGFSLSMSRIAIRFGAFFRNPMVLFGRIPGLLVRMAGNLRTPFRFLATAVQSIWRLRPLVTNLLRISLVGVIVMTVIGFVVKAFELIRGNVDGIRTFLLETWDRVKARVLVIYDVLKPIIGWFASDGVVGQFFHKLVFGTVMMLGDAVDGIMRVIQTIILVVKKFSEDWKSVIASPLKAWQEASSEAARLTAAKEKQLMDQNVARIVAERRAERAGGREVPTEREKQPNYDFRGSRFDITQKFAEGFDPDRIAVAFSNDLASLAERKLQTGMAPVFAIR